MRIIVYGVKINPKSVIKLTYPTYSKSWKKIITIGRLMDRRKLTDTIFLKQYWTKITIIKPESYLRKYKSVCSVKTPL